MSSSSVSGATEPVSGALFGGDDFRGVGPVVDERLAGLRVDLYLAKYYPFRSREAWARACREAELRVNGAAVKPSYKLRTGDRVARHHPLSEEPEVDARLAVLAENAGVLAVYKPGNLPMHEAGRFRRNTFSWQLRDQIGPAWAAVHRLDRETSGIVLCAADPALRAALSQDFIDHKVRKEYLAITDGAAPQERWSVDVPIDCPIESRLGRRLQAAMTPRAAETLFQVEARAPGTTLVRAFPRTGRTNQIRIHLAHAALPIVGDLRFGAGRDRPGVPRHFLHATRLTLDHPATGEPWTIEAPLPPDMRSFWDAEILKSLE